MVRYFDQKRQTKLFRCDLCHRCDLPSAITLGNWDFCGECWQRLDEDTQITPGEELPASTEMNDT